MQQNFSLPYFTPASVPENCGGRTPRADWPGEVEAEQWRWEVMLCSRKLLSTHNNYINSSSCEALNTYIIDLQQKKRSNDTSNSRGRPTQISGLKSMSFRGPTTCLIQIPPEESPGTLKTHCISVHGLQATLLDQQFWQRVIP